MYYFLRHIGCQPNIFWEWEAEKKQGAEVGEAQGEGACEDKATLRQETTTAS